MKHLKTSLLSAALIFTCITPSQAGIPVSIVLDAPAMANQIQNYAHMLKEYATMLEQLEQMRSQFEQMEKEYSSITGVRNLGDILNDPRFKEYLPDDWQNIYEGVRNSGYEGLSGTAKGIRDATKIFDSCANLTNPTEKKICNAKAVKPAQDQAFAQDAYRKSQDRVGQIEGLMQEINRTRDPKALSEVTARIQAEQALIQNEQTKLELYQASADAEQQLLRQQEREATRQRFASINYGHTPKLAELNHGF